jgi:hypothetical protein
MAQPAHAISSPDPTALALQLVALERRFAEYVAQTDARLAALEAATPIDEPLVFAVARATDGRVFSADELLGHAVVDAELAAALGSATPQQIGVRLLALLDRPRAHVVLRRLDKRTNRGRLWCVQVLTP